MNGKGDKYRPVVRAKYEEGYLRIFGRNTLEQATREQVQRLSEDDYNTDELILTRNYAVEFVNLVVLIVLVVLSVMYCYMWFGLNWVIKLLGGRK